jgi:hypothetical protein
MILAAKLPSRLLRRKWRQNRKDSRSGEKRIPQWWARGCSQRAYVRNKAFGITDHLLVAAFGIAAALPEQIIDR